MISVAEALTRICTAVAVHAPIGSESVAVSDALGRVLAVDLAARLTQPPSAVSAMDGWAVRAADVEKTPTELRQIGYVPAGSVFDGTVGVGEAVRLFTGAPIPDGADAVVIQENIEANGDRIVVREGSPRGKHIRVAGGDFMAGDLRLRVGQLLTARDVGLAAAMNHPWLTVRRRPRVGVLATGSEIARPGEPIGPARIVSSNSFTLAALIRASGGEPVDLGIAPDDDATLRRMVATATGLDLLVTTGGASVGDHDLVRSSLGAEGLELDFWRIAMRPGKPLIFGRLGATPVLGLPGNPVSTLVGGLLFLRPAIETLLGLVRGPKPQPTARTAVALAAGDTRQDYLRAVRHYDESGACWVTPAPVQDSSMLSVLAASDCLVIRPPHAAAAAPGETVDILPFDDGLLSI